LLTAQEAMEQASMTSHDYAMKALYDLCDLLGVKRGSKDWQDRLAPFAPVWAAMITAAATDFDTWARTPDLPGNSLEHARHGRRAQSSRRA